MRALWLKIEMKILSILIVFLLISCTPVTEREFNCGQSQFEGEWVQIYPSQAEIDNFLSVLSSSTDTNYKEGPNFWYRNNFESILVCSITMSLRKQKQYSPGCFTARALLKKDVSGYKLVDDQIIVCT